MIPGTREKAAAVTGHIATPGSLPLDLVETKEPVAPGLHHESDPRKDRPE
jgi:hypothetical protein